MKVDALFVLGDAPPQMRSVSTDDLPAGELLVQVQWSGLNYKDALAVTGTAPIIKGDLPFIPGIDLAGVVLDSADDRYAPGDQVLQTGWGLGETRWGGYATTQRLRADHVVPVPEALSTRQSMVIGTAGFTAALGVAALEDHAVTPASGPVLVTGATGGVGSVAVRLLARAGYEVHASTGRPEHASYLESLGASRIVDRAELERGPEGPLMKGRWAGVVDSVGGSTLASCMAQVRRHGCLAVCGLAGGAALETTVYPLILRGVVLSGIDSNTCPQPLRHQAWQRLAVDLDADTLEQIASTIELADVPEAAQALLANRSLGRAVVRCA